MKNIPLLLLLFCLVGCSTVSVNRDFDSSYNFSALTSYKVEKQTVDSENATRVSNQLMDRRFDQSLESNLTQKGYILSTTPTFTVQHGYYIKTVIRSDPFSSNMGFGYGTSRNSRRYYNDMRMGTNYGVEQYDVGILVIDILDTKTNQLVWRGKGRIPVVSDSDQPQKISREVDKVVTEIMLNFPPQ